jgi:hypothetical protein
MYLFSKPILLEKYTGGIPESYPSVVASMGQGNIALGEKFEKARSRERPIDIIGLSLFQGEI